MRTRDATLAVNYSQQARECACGCGGGCLHTAVWTAARDAVVATLNKIRDTWSPAAREAAARARKAHAKASTVTEHRAAQADNMKMKKGATRGTAKHYELAAFNHHMAASALEKGDHARAQSHKEAALMHRGNAEASDRRMKE